MSPGTGAALRLLAASVDAKAVAEIGTGCGVSGIHLLHGMRPDGVLTTVDPEPEHQQSARQAFRASGFASNRARFIPGRALEVLPRLADAGYDLVFCDGDRLEVLDYLAESLRLLRPGGLVVFEGVFAHGRTVDSGPQPTEVVRLRELLRTVRESQERPFDIRSSRGPASFQHRVEYEVTYPGYRTEKRVVMVEPGKPITLRGSLVAE